MPAQALANIYAVMLGFAIAGLLASAYHALTNRPLSFRLLGEPPKAALACVPLLTFGAPFIIMRNTVRGRMIEHRRFEYAMFATIIACFWSLMSGTAVVALVRHFGG